MNLYFEVYFYVLIMTTAVQAVRAVRAAAVRQSRWLLPAASRSHRHRGESREWWGIVGGTAAAGALVSVVVWFSLTDACPCFGVPPLAARVDRCPTVLLDTAFRQHRWGGRMAMGIDLAMCLPSGSHTVMPPLGRSGLTRSHARSTLPTLAPPPPPPPPTPTPTATTLQTSR